MTTAAGHHVVPWEPVSLPELRAADRGVASSLESVLAGNTRRTYDAQWRIFAGWCDQVGLRFLPAEPLAVARYLAARAGSGALTADVLAAIRLTAVQARRRGRGFETREQAAEWGEFDVALVAVFSGAGLRRSEAAALT